MAVGQTTKSQDVDQKLFMRITSFSSIFAGVIGKLVCHPIDTIRAKLQVQKEFMTMKSYTQGLLTKTLKETLRNEGVKGLYRGLGISVLGTGPAFSLYLTSYEWAKDILLKSSFFSNKQGLTFFMAGLTAEAISCVFWLPIDVVKERLQVQKNLGIYHYKNTFDAISTILRTEGFVGLYRAYGATIGSFGPFSAMYFLFYEKFKAYFCENPQSPKFFESMFLSGLSGSLAGFLVNPLEIVKLRMQVQRASRATGDSQAAQMGNFGYKNLLHGIYLMIKNEGVASLTKGSLAKVLYTTPNTAICMSVSEVLRTYLLKKYQTQN